MAEEMTIDERRKYVKLMATRYQKGTRTERSQLLTEMEQVTTLYRKHLIRLLNGEGLERKKRQTPRKRTYGLEVERVVLRIWESLDYICAERLTPHFSEDRQTSSELWCAAVSSISRKPIGDHQHRHGRANATQASLTQSPLAPSRATTSQSGAASVCR